MFHQKIARITRAAFRLSLVVVALACGSPAQNSSRIQNLVSAGKLDGMQWPNFSDHRPWLQKLYEPVGFNPVWVQGTTPSPQARAMIDLFAHAWQKGLEPDDYDASRWEKRLESLQSPGGDPDAFDVALSVCAMRYVSDLRIGRINPKHLQFDLTVEAKKYDLAQFVRDKLLTASDPATAIKEVEPPFVNYRRTEDALARYIELARSDNGEQLPVPAKALDPGQAYAGVPRLVQLLKLVGDLPADFQTPNSGTYDPGIAEGVKKFQRRHGLDGDGRLGPSTVKQLNVPLTDRVRQLKLTLERWRWLPEEFSAPPIIVNIPDFRLRRTGRKEQDRSRNAGGSGKGNADANPGVHAGYDVCGFSSLLECAAGDLRPHRASGDQERSRLRLEKELRSYHPRREGRHVGRDFR